MLRSDSRSLLPIRVVALALAFSAAIACQRRAINPILEPGHPGNPSTASSPIQEVASVFGAPPGQAVLPPQTQPAKPPASAMYVCPMHPQVRQTEPGECPICHMPLRPEQASQGEDQP